MGYVRRSMAREDQARGRTPVGGVHGAVRRGLRSLAEQCACGPVALGRSGAGSQDGQGAGLEGERAGMSWNAKVHWTEGLFLRPHHLQQGDRYLENALESRTRHITPYPWGFASLEIDRDLAQQSKFALRRGGWRHARRRAVRFSRRMPGAGADRGAGGRGGPARLAHHAGARRQHPRGQPGSGGKRGALRCRAPRP